MSTNNTDASDQFLQNVGGIISESVMDQIYDVSRVPLPLTDMIGTQSHGNQFFEWLADKLNDAVINDQEIDGDDLTGDDSKLNIRLGNFSEIRTKIVAVSTRAQEVDTFGYANELARQVTRRQQELRRNVEATAMSNNASVRGTSSVAGVTGGLAAWLIGAKDIEGTTQTGATNQNVYRGTGGADGGWNTATSVVDAATPGTAEALSETNLRNCIEAIYKKGGEVSAAMMTPACKRLISQFLFSSSARVATIVNDTPSGAAENRQAQGSVDLYITDFGSIKLIPNRLMPEFGDADESMLFLLDPSMLAMSYLQGYRTEPQAKTGLSDVRQMSVDWGLCVKNTDGLGGVADIDETAAMVA